MKKDPRSAPPPPARPRDLNVGCFITAQNAPVHTHTCSERAHTPDVFTGYVSPLVPQCWDRKIITKAGPLLVTIGDNPLSFSFFFCPLVCLDALLYYSHVAPLTPCYLWKETKKLLHASVEVSNLACLWWSRSIFILTPQERFSLPARAFNAPVARSGGPKMPSPWTPWLGKQRAEQRVCCNLRVHRFNQEAAPHRWDATAASLSAATDISRAPPLICREVRGKSSHTGTRASPLWEAPLRSLCTQQD